MNLDIYSGRDLQRFLSLMNQFEAEGVSDVRVVRSRIQGFNNERMKNSRKSLTPADRKRARIDKLLAKNRPVCPQCGSLRWQRKTDIDGVVFDECGKCRYSELVE